MNIRKLKYPLEFKKEVCENAQKLNIKSAALMYGLNSDTVGRWVRKYKVSGINGLTAVRRVIKKKKLSLDTINKIKEYRSLHPDATLKDVRSYFGLNCSLVLLSKKTSGIKRNERKTTIRGDLILSTRKVYEIKFRHEVSSLHEFSMCSCAGKTDFTGFTQTKNSRNICLFIKLALSTLKTDKKKHFRILTRLKYIKLAEFDTIVRSAYNTDLIVCEDLKYARKSGLYCSHKIKSTSDIIYDSYRHYFSQAATSGVLKNAVVTPLINIDRFKATAKYEIIKYSFPAETKTALFEALKDIKKDGDSAVLEFDYEKAEREYEKAYSALMSSEIKDPEFQLELLMKRAELLYNTENYQSALMLFRDCVVLSKIITSYENLGSAYFHIGMIYNIFHNRKGALKYMLNSKRALVNGEEDLSKALYYRTLIKSDLIKKNYEAAEKNAENYTHYAKRNCAAEFIGNSLSQYGLIYYQKKEYKRSAIWYGKAMRYNIENNNIFDVCENIQGLINIYALGILKNYNKLKILLAELRYYSRKAGMVHISYESDYRMGVYYYNRSEYAAAVKLLYSSLQGNKLYSPEYFYISNLYFLGRTYYALGELNKAIRCMNRLSISAQKVNNLDYVLYSNRIACKIYYDKESYKRSAKKAKEVFALAIKLSEFYIAGEAKKILAMIADKRLKHLKACTYYNKALEYYNIFIQETGTDISQEINFIKNMISQKIPSQ